MIEARLKLQQEKTRKWAQGENVKWRKTENYSRKRIIFCSKCGAELVRWYLFNNAVCPKCKAKRLALAYRRRIKEKRT